MVTPGITFASPPVLRAGFVEITSLFQLAIPVDPEIPATLVDLEILAMAGKQPWLPLKPTTTQLRYSDKEVGC